MSLLSRLAISKRGGERKEEATRLLNQADAARHQAVNDVLAAEVARKEAEANGGTYEEAPGITVTVSKGWFGR